MLRKILSRIDPIPLPPFSWWARRGLCAAEGALAATLERDVVALRVVARGLWIRTDLRGLSVVLNTLRTVFPSVRAQLSVDSSTF